MSTLKNLFFLLSILTLGFFLLSSTPGLAQTDNIGVIDMKKAVEDSKPGKAATDSLKKKYDGLKKTLDAKQKELEKKDQDLRDQAATLNREALEKKSADLANDVNTFREQTQKSAEDMQKAMNDAMNPVITKAQKAVADLAKTHGYTLVIDVNEGGVVFAADAVNLTAEVTKALDAK